MPLLCLPHTHIHTSSSCHTTMCVAYVLNICLLATQLIASIAAKWHIFMSLGGFLLQVDNFHCWCCCGFCLMLLLLLLLMLLLLSCCMCCAFNQFNAKISLAIRFSRQASLLKDCYLSRCLLFNYALPRHKRLPPTHWPPTVPAAADGNLLIYALLADYYCVLLNCHSPSRGNPKREKEVQKCRKSTRERWLLIISSQKSPAQV